MFSGVDGQDIELIEFEFVNCSPGFNDLSVGSVCIVTATVAVAIISAVRSTVVSVPVPVPTVVITGVTIVSLSRRALTFFVPSLGPAC